MTDYKDFPPYANLKTILITKPTAALLYIELWKRKRASNMLSISIDSIAGDYLVSPTVFRNFMLALTRLGVLSYVENGDNFILNLFTSPSSLKNA